MEWPLHAQTAADLNTDSFERAECGPNVISSNHPGGDVHNPAVDIRGGHLQLQPAGCVQAGHHQQHSRRCKWAKPGHSCSLKLQGWVAVP